MIEVLLFIIGIVVILGSGWVILKSYEQEKNNLIQKLEQEKNNLIQKLEQKENEYSSMKNFMSNSKNIGMFGEEKVRNELRKFIEIGYVVQNLETDDNKKVEYAWRLSNGITTAS